MYQNGLEKLVGLQIGITYSLLTIQLQKMLEPCKLAPKEAVVLWLSAENPGVTQSEIAAFLGVGRATVMQAVRSLKEAGRVELRSISADRRKLGLHVTVAGAVALEHARAIITEQEAMIRTRIAPETCDLVIASMQQLR
jgi:DNA-binding MarR family transcriptional regulator